MQIESTSRKKSIKQLNILIPSRLIDPFSIALMKNHSLESKLCFPFSTRNKPLVGSSHKTTASHGMRYSIWKACMGIIYYISNTSAIGHRKWFSTFGDLTADARAHVHV